MQGSLGGYVPDGAMKYAIKKSLAVVDRMLIRYERNGKAVDAELRGAFPPPPTFGELGADECLVMGKCRDLGSEAADVPWEVIKSALPFTKMWIKTLPPARGGKSVALGKATCVLDCSAHNAGAWQFNFDSRERNLVSAEEGNQGTRAKRAQKR
jgi:hypothetical protein